MVDKNNASATSKTASSLIKMDKAWFIQSHTGNIKDCYYFEKKLGAGGYGAVYLAKNKLTGNHLLTLLSFKILNSAYLGVRVAVKAM
jgi:hypothetical protein